MAILTKTAVKARELIFNSSNHLPPNMSARHRKLYKSFEDEIRLLGSSNKDLVKLLKDAKHRIIAHYLYN